MVPEKSAFDFISAVDEQKKDKQEELANQTGSDKSDGLVKQRRLVL